MKRKKIGKRLCALTLVSVLALSTAGCAQKNDEQTGEKENVSAEETGNSEVTTDEDGRQMIGNVYLDGLPLCKETETITILVNSTADPNEMELFKRFEEETNVKVNWLAYSGDVATEKKNLMYSSGEYPDMVCGWLLNDTDIMRYGANEGIYIPLEDLIDQYAPRIKYCLDNFPKGRDTVTTPDGHIYTVPIMAPQPITENVVLINRSWLDAVGMEMPSTVDELYDVLVAFRDKDPNGNGIADEIPFSTQSHGLRHMLAWFGLGDSTDQHIAVKDKELVFVPSTDNYYEGVKYLNKLFGEGLLDQEIFTHSDDQFKAKGKEDETVYGLFIDWSGPGVVGQERFEDEYTALPPLSSSISPNAVWPQGSASVFKDQCAITKNAENPMLILRWLDYIYDEDNSVQIMKGPYGELIERKEDGSFTALEPPEGENMDSYRNKISITGMPYCIMPDIQEKLPLSAFEQVKKDADDIYAPYITKEPIPAYWLTPEESSEISTIQTDLDKYVKDTFASWVSGQSNIDEEWDAYREQLKVLGLDKYMEVMTEAVFRGRQ